MAKSSARSNLEFNHANPSEASPLLPTEQPPLSRPVIYSMSRLLVEKRARSPAPPPSTPTGHSETDSPRYSGTLETYQSIPPSGPSAQCPPSSQTKLRLFKHFLTVSPNLILENSGSVARDHLASERTFLAYVRTSLAIASTGVALVQLFTISGLSTMSPSSNNIMRNSPQLQKYARPLGAVTVMVGLAVLVIGIFRYFSIQTALPKGKFPVARVTTAFIAVVLSALVVTVFSILVGVRR